MTLQEYLALIPSQHRGRPKFMTTMQVLLQGPCAVEGLLEELRTAFDLDMAVGQQLDATGVRIGRTRFIRLPITAYFSWNTEGLGWNEGYWKGQYDPSSGMHTMPDDLFRQLLYAKVAANQWDGTIPDAYAAWEIAFGGQESTIIIQDNQDMSMVVGVAGKNMSTLFEQLLLQGYVPLKPEGVRIAWFALPPEESAGGSLFAWNCESDGLAGWNEGLWPRKMMPATL